MENSKKKSATIRIRMTPEEKRDIEDFSRYRGQTVSLVARAFLRRGLRAYAYKPFYPFVEESN